MADTTIDTLRIDISVQDKAEGDNESSSQKVRKLSNALVRLQKTLMDFDASIFKASFKSMADGIKPFTTQITKVKDALADLNSIVKSGQFKELSKELSSVKPKVETEIFTPDKKSQGQQLSFFEEGTTSVIPEYNQEQQATPIAETAKEQKKTQKEIENSAKSYGVFVKSVTKADGSITTFYKDIKDGKTVLTRMNEEGQVLGQTFEAISTSSLKQFFASIKRIAMYRMIRTALNVTVKSLQKGAKAIATYDAQTGSAMSNLTSSLLVFQNSLGVIIAPLVQVVAPVVREIAKVIGNIANAISYLTAKLQGNATYLKVNVDYMKDMYQTSSLLDFDQFSALSSENDVTGMFETEEVDNVAKSVLDSLNAIQVVIAGIGAALAVMATYKIIEWIRGGGITTLVGELKNVQSKINDISSAGLIATAAFSFVTSLVNLISVINDWDSASFITKITAIAAAVAGVATVVFAIIAAIPGIGWAKIAKAIAIGAAGGTMLLTAVSAMRFADGGMMDTTFQGTGTLYAIAGESGAEIVATGSKGTGVTNVEQIEQAFYNALALYNVAKNTGSGEIVVKLDGKEIARQQARNTATALSQAYNVEFKPR